MWTSGGIQKVTLAAAVVTLTFTAPIGGAKLTLYVIQDATGSRVPVFPAAVHWQGNVTPTFTTTASRMDICTFIYDATATNYYGVMTPNFVP